MRLYNRLKLLFLKPLSFLASFFPKQILSLRYFRSHGEFINWKHPQNTQVYAAYLLFQKRTDINLLADLADKVRVHDFVKERIGERYLNPLYGYWDSVDKIDFEALPDRFVLKTNNGCGNNIIVKNKSRMNIRDIKNKLDYWLHFPYGDLTGQIHYSRIKPLILAEKYLEQSKGKDILPYDYKFFCYQGKPLYVLYYEDRKLNGHLTPNMLFDMNWNPIPKVVRHPTAHSVSKPISFDEMKLCVARLCAGLEFVRVDFYEIDDRPVFGEMTFTPDMLTNILEDFSPLMKLGIK